MLKELLLGATVGDLFTTSAPWPLSDSTYF